MGGTKRSSSFVEVRRRTGVEGGMIGFVGVTVTRGLGGSERRLSLSVQDGHPRVQCSRKRGRTGLVRVASRSALAMMAHEKSAVGLQADSGRPRRGIVVGLACLCVALSVLNRVLFRIQLVPMRDFSFFVAVLTSACYVVVYQSVFAIRSKAGIITDEMRDFSRQSWRFFLMLGLMEALVFAL